MNWLSKPQWLATNYQLIFHPYAPTPRLSPVRGGTGRQSFLSIQHEKAEQPLFHLILQCSSRYGMQSGSTPLLTEPGNWGYCTAEQPHLPSEPTRFHKPGMIRAYKTLFLPLSAFLLRSEQLSE